MLAKETAKQAALGFVLHTKGRVLLFWSHSAYLGFNLMQFVKKDVWLQDTYMAGKVP